MVSTHILISKSSSPRTNPLVTVLSIPITIGIYYYYYYYYSLRVFHIRISWWSFTGVWMTASLLKSPALFSVFWDAVVWMVSTCPPTSKSLSPFNNPLVTMPKASIMIGIIVTFLFHSFFQFSSKVQVLILLFTFFQFYSVVSWDSKVHNFASSLSFFLLITLRSGLLAEIWWSVCMSKSYRSLCVSFSRTDAGLCMYDLFVLSNLNFLHISQWITLPTQSCTLSNLLHLLIMWLIVSSLSPHHLHLLFCCILSIFALIWLVLMVLFCAAIMRDSVSLLKFPFLSHLQVFSCEMLFIRHLKYP